LPPYHDLLPTNCDNKETKSNQISNTTSRLPLKSNSGGTNYRSPRNKSDTFSADRKQEEWYMAKLPTIHTLANMVQAIYPGLVCVLVTFGDSAGNDIHSTSQQVPVFYADHTESYQHYFRVLP
jgi:hypothetical protein